MANPDIAGGQQGEITEMNLKEQRNFADFDFSQLVFYCSKEKEIMDTQTKYVWVAEQPIYYVDKNQTKHNLLLKVTRTRLISNTTKRELGQSYAFVVSSQPIETDKCLQMNLSITYNGGRRECVAKILKHPEFLRDSGFGEECYKKMVYFMEHISQSQKIDFEHLAYRFSPLSPEKWHEIFGEFLLSRGYEVTRYASDVNGREWPVELKKKYTKSHNKL